ncbi:MAG: DNA-binding response regulator [Chlorobi bacterium CHB2]|nr:DNA-binding response regulator [Chlorobi bacterium CHB2]
MLLMEPLRALIVDDETLGRETLKQFLGRYCPEEIQVVAMAASAEEARWGVSQHEPDVVFLDVEMPRENGFDFLRSVPEREFAVVFVTAYDHYALRAIRASATDYLLKPIDIDELQEAVRKLVELQRARAARQAGYNARLRAVLENTSDNRQKLTRLIVPSLHGFSVIAVDDILHCKAENNYTSIHLRTGENVLACKPLKEYDELLDGSEFFRVHKSFLVNLQHVRGFVRSDLGGGTVMLTGGISVEVSRRRKDQLIQKLQEFGLSA